MVDQAGCWLCGHKRNDVWLRWLWHFGRFRVYLIAPMNNFAAFCMRCVAKKNMLGKLASLVNIEQELTCQNFRYIFKFKILLDVIKKGFELT